MSTSGSMVVKPCRLWRCRPPVCFWGWRVVRAAPDGRHHGEGEHDERDVAMPTMPGAGLIVVEPQFVFGGLETIFDRPTMSLDRDEGFDACSSRTPGGEERQVTISDVAADQEASRP